jgi:enoyl-CoA hydratase
MTELTDTLDAPVRFDVEGHIGIITINRPRARNAINGEVARGIEAALDRLEGDLSLRVGVLYGTPPVFCAGADLKEIAAGRRAELRTAMGGFAGIVRRARTKPLIAAVDGPALGGGTEIALACDLIVASEASTFGIPEVTRGLVAAAGGLFRLPARLPVAIAMQMALTGQSIDAATARSYGLVNVTCEEGKALVTACELAARIASNAPIAVQASRRVIVESRFQGDDDGWRLSEAAMTQAMDSADMREGVTAFKERRAPQWTGR